MQPIHLLSRVLERTGQSAVALCVRSAFVAGIVTTVLCSICLPRTWSPPVRDEVVRQIYFTGVKSVTLVLFIALLIGPALVSQLLVWSNLIGETAILSQFVALLVLRDLGPILVNLIIIGRSGVAITSEVGTLNASGAIRMLDASGVEPFRYVLLPRVVGCAVAALGLTQIFGLVVLLSGYFFAVVYGIANMSLNDYLAGMLAQTTLTDLVLILMKTVLPAMVTASVCCWRGLLVVSSTTDIARELPTAFVICATVLFVISGILTAAI